MVVRLMLFNLRIFSRLRKARLAQSLVAVVLPPLTAKLLLFLVLKFTSYPISSEGNKNSAFKIDTTTILSDIMESVS